MGPRLVWVEAGTVVGTLAWRGGEREDSRCLFKFVSGTLFLQKTNVHQVVIQNDIHWRFTIVYVSCSLCFLLLSSTWFHSELSVDSNFPNLKWVRPTSSSFPREQKEVYNHSYSQRSSYASLSLPSSSIRPKIPWNKSYGKHMVSSHLQLPATHRSHSCLWSLKLLIEMLVVEVIFYSDFWWAL